MDERERHVSAIRHALNARLSGIVEKPDAWQGVLRRVRGGTVVKKKLSVGLALAIVLLLLAGVALALTLSDAFFTRAATLQSEKGNLNTWPLEDKLALIGTMEESGIAIPADQWKALQKGGLPDEEANRLANEILAEAKVAREALMEKYGFSHETFTFFSGTTSFQKGEESASSLWVVTYAPRQFPEQIGTYEVRILAATGQVQEAAWSFDNMPEAAGQPDNWSAKAWGPRLIDRLDDFELEHEQKREAMEERLGDYADWSIADRAALDQMYVDACYPLGDDVINILPGPEDIKEPEAIQFAKECIEEEYALDPSALDLYTVHESFFQMPAPQEKLWIIEFWQYTAMGEEKYVVEFTSPLRRVELCRLYQNGIARMPENRKAQAKETPAASSAPVSKAQACEIAWADMKSRYGFEEITRSYFNAQAEEEQNPSLWKVSFTSNSYNPAKVGTYRIGVDATDGSVVSAAWDLEAGYRNQGPREPWRGAELWSAYEYNQYALLRQAAKAILAQADVPWNLPFERRAEHDALYRQAGYDRAQYYHGLPGSLDIALEKAVQIAKEAVWEKYKPDRGAADQADILYEFDVSDETLYKWRIRLLVYGEEDMMYTVELDSRSGEVLKCTAQPAGNG